MTDSFVGAGGVVGLISDIHVGCIQSLEKGVDEFSNGKIK